MFSQVHNRLRKNSAGRKETWSERKMRTVRPSADRPKLIKLDLKCRSTMCP